MLLPLTPVLSVTPPVAGLLTLLLVGLGLRISKLRGRHRVIVGDGGVPELGRAIRAHGNLVEHAMPLLLLLLLWELQGAPRVGLAAAGGLIVLARVLHALGFSARSKQAHVAGAGLTYALEGGLALAVLVTAFLR